MKAEKKKVTITTDGGCNPNPGQGAWAAILRYGNACKTISGASAETTTNNRMELTAIAEALKALREPCVVRLRTDSQQAIFAVCAGYLAPGSCRREKWERSGKNMDLVRRIWAQLERHVVHPHWVRGHAADPDNERCDAECSRRIQDARS